MICPHDGCGLEKPELSGYEPEENMKLTAGVTDGALYEEGHFVGRMNTHEKAAEIERAVNSHEALLEAAKSILAFLRDCSWRKRTSFSQSRIGSDADELIGLVEKAIAQAEGGQ